MGMEWSIMKAALRWCKVAFWRTERVGFFFLGMGWGCDFWRFLRVKATPTCTFRLGEKYQKPTGAANLCMRGWPPRTPRILMA